MLVIRLEDDSSNAFRRGFMKGMAAPLMIYNVTEAPAIHNVFQIVAPNYGVEEAMKRDWSAVGSDIRTVMDEHAETA